ncbi:MAG: hypothetical protein U0842_25300, partial [Candidatus Binatia bacterium]
MHIRTTSLRLAILCALGLLAGSCSNGSGGSPTASCTAAAPKALSSCVEEYGAAVGVCYLGNGGPCAADDIGTDAALEDLESSVRAKCEDGAFGGLSTDALVGR